MAAEHEMVLTFSLWVSWGSARTAIDIAGIFGCGLFQHTKDGYLQRGGAEAVRHIHSPLTSRVPLNVEDGPSLIIFVGGNTHFLFSSAKPCSFNVDVLPPRRLDD